MLFGPDNEFSSSACNRGVSGDAIKIDTVLVFGLSNTPCSKERFSAKDWKFLGHRSERISKPCYPRFFNYSGIKTVLIPCEFL